MPVGPEAPAGRSGLPPDATVRAAVADLVRRSGCAPADVTLVRLAEVVWPDGSLGCPRPGRSYTQALVPGLLVLLAVGGRRYEYHAGAGRAPFLCEHPPAPLSRAPEGR